jgi:hypothetical protein
MKNNENKWTSVVLLEAKHWRYFPKVSLLVEPDPGHERYCHTDTEPLEVDQPELMNSQYGRQN